jgi:hypothetical protein
VPAVAEREEWEGTGSGELEDKRMLKIRYRVRAMSLDLIGKKGSHASGLDGSQAAAPAGAAAVPTSLLDLKSEDIARELTMDEFELYCGVEPREFLGQAWQKERKAELAPNLTRLIERFNKIGYWVATEVLTKHDVKVRVKYIKKFIKIAFRCYECNNFNAIMQILSGLNNSSVKRLKVCAMQWNVRLRPHSSHCWCACRVVRVRVRSSRTRGRRWASDRRRRWRSSSR